MNKKLENQIEERVKERLYANEERKAKESLESSNAIMAQSAKEIEEKMKKESEKRNNHSIIKKYNKMQEKIKKESENSPKL